jgi:two-component system, NarL family, nitrate/nitrite response regulator NarL
MRRELLTNHRPPNQIRVLLVEADVMRCELLAGALKRGRNNFNLKSMVASSQEAVQFLERYKPDVAVVSADLPDGPEAGFKLLQKVRQSHAPRPVVMLLASRNYTSVVNVFRAGGRGVFYRDQHCKALAKCIRAVHRGQFWASTEDLKHVFKALAHTGPPELDQIRANAALTKREEEIMRMIGLGMKTHDAAQALRITEHSVRNYLSGVFAKLGVSSRVELILYCMARGKHESV